MKICSSLLIICLFFLSSCTSSVHPEELYGRWNYMKVENSNPADSLTQDELLKQSPAIIFSKDKKLVIEWGGKTLSHGTFRMDGHMIRYTEFLDGGRKREFPFLIKQLNDTMLVFVTMEQNYTRITALKEK